MRLVFAKYPRVFGSVSGTGCKVMSVLRLSEFQRIGLPKSVLLLCRWVKLCSFDADNVLLGFVDSQCFRGENSETIIIAFRGWKTSFNRDHDIVGASVSEG